MAVHKSGPTCNKQLLFYDFYFHNFQQANPQIMLITHFLNHGRIIIKCSAEFVTSLTCHYIYRVVTIKYPTQHFVNELLKTFRKYLTKASALQTNESQ